ncbi:MAG: prepilin-type N-terminal cleavage/methylation domain-containing protein [Planctomycetota bacterium]|jgi:prepilin-type N-terminal cleavage/methylation domain-containing protein
MTATTNRSPATTSPCRSANEPRSGFTLLELMVVVFILCTLALGAVSLVDSTDHGVRDDVTRGRLLELREAVLAYATDLGVLPDCVDDLVRAPSGAPGYGLLKPDVFGATVSLPGLPKGWRGPYVALPPRTALGDAAFRDGWGNVSRGASGNPDATADALHHGWDDLDPSAEPFVLRSLGADGAAGDSGETDFDKDISLDLAATAWSVDLAGWSVDIKNPTSTDRDLAVAIVVFRSDASGGSWSRHDTATVKIVASSTASLTFPADSVVPCGRHLLVVVDGSGPFANSDSTFSTRQVALRPRTLPEVTLVIR